jgi:anti-sigma regulatory factor (Ser/Thr protein kinase)
MDGAIAQRPGATGERTPPAVPVPPRAGSSPGCAAAPAGPPESRWRRVFPGDERQLGLLRRWLSSLLPPCPARDDVVCVASELAANALRHSASGRGDWFAVEISRHPGMVRVAVADCGAASGPREVDDPDSENGRGMVLVRGLSARYGVRGDHRSRLVWADIPWADPASPSPAREPGEAAIHHGEACLARQFAGTAAWFGRSTHQWWALTTGHGLISAPTAQQLATTLARLADSPAQATAPGVSHPALLAADEGKPH